jgi:Ni,Fe-hydrogenase III small subunit
MPRLVASFGDCALGCSVLGLDSELAGPADAILPVDLRTPGCPPTADALAAAFAELCDRAALDANQ